MDSIISYDSVKVLLANLPSIEPRPNFFNLRALRTHFARALKRIPCPQSGVNGWAGAIMSPEMYALIDPNPFHLNIATKTNTPDQDASSFKPQGMHLTPGRCESHDVRYPTWDCPATTGPLYRSCPTPIYCRILICTHHKGKCREVCPPGPMQPSNIIPPQSHQCLTSKRSPEFGQTYGTQVSHGKPRHIERPHEAAAQGPQKHHQKDSKTKYEHHTTVQ
jgi:hypothetical protein